MWNFGVNGRCVNMPPLRGLIFLGFGSTKIPLLTELTDETPKTNPRSAGEIRRARD